MVAITVILAAVIAAFVLDIGDTGEPVQANIDVDNTDDDDVDVTVTNVDSVDRIFVRCDGDIQQLAGDDGDSADLSVGSTATIDLEDCEDGTLNVIGEVGGSESIIKSFDYEGDD